MKLLIVEDGKELSDSICNYFTEAGYICETAATLDDAREKLESFTYDCLILDIMLPDGNGFSLLDFLKEEKTQEMGILILSAVDSTENKIRGLEEGADDYITKPFHLSELHARIKAIYRRRNLNGNTSPMVTYAAIQINTETKEAFVHGQLLDLTQKEFDLLQYFIVNKNRVLSRQAIAVHLWGDYTDHLSNVDFVYQHVKNIRRKISQFTKEDYIQTIYSIGYKLKAEST